MHALQAAPKTGPTPQHPPGPAGLLPASPDFTHLTRAGTTCAAELAEARACWELAWQEVDRDGDALEGKDQDVIATADLESGRRRQLIAQDRGGHLHRALIAAQKPAALAQTKDEVYRAAALRAYLECDAGHHEAELQQARTLMALAPRRELSLQVLRHAAECNRLMPLARQVDAALKALQHAPDTRNPG